MPQTISSPRRITPDEAALQALAEGRLVVDTETGAVSWADGRRAESPTREGYGNVPLYVRGHGSRIVGAHRVVWLFLHGPIPPNLVVNHINKRTWDNRPANLELVTRSGNWHHGAGGEYVSIGDDGIDPAWLDQVRQLFASGEIDADAIHGLGGEELSSPIKPYAGGSVVAARQPWKAWGRR